MSSICYVCEQTVVPASGYSQASVLIIGEFPGPLELKYGRPFVATSKIPSAGSVLRQEFIRLGVDVGRFRMCNLWYHEPPKRTGKKEVKQRYEDCFNASKTACLEEAKGKDAILLIGSECVEFFTGYKVNMVTGLQVESNMLSAPTIYACIQPASALKPKGVVGEVRFAIENFTNHVLKERLI